MTGPERGFLLLASQLGNPQRKPLTVAQMRVIANRVMAAPTPTENREITEQDLYALGCSEELARRIVALLSETALLDRYLRKGARAGCMPLTRVSPGYPEEVWQRLRLDSPGCLWCKGDVSLLNTPKISLVGSRALQRENEQFAREVGRQAALQGYTLVSGNAVGADWEAQQACLDAGGSVISVVAYELNRHPLKDRVLYMAEEGYDEPFSPQRALSRNRVIHSLGQKTFVAQSSLEKGGTWDGTVRNLRFHWSPVFCFDDGSESVSRLVQMGAREIQMEDLSDIGALRNENESLI